MCSDFSLKKRYGLKQNRVYLYEQNGGVYKSLAEVGVYPGGLLTKWGGL